MPEEINIQELIESLETYEFFSNQVKVNIANNQGIRLILEKIAKIEGILEIIKNSQNKPETPIENAQKQPYNPTIPLDTDLSIPIKDGQ